MTTTHRHPHYQYWPFPISDLDMELPEEMEGVKFLENSYSEGFEAYREPPNQISDYYVARTESRIGTILQRGRRNRWEIVLTESGETRFKAYVTEFRVAGEEVRKWLKGGTVSEILENITGYLAVLGGSQSSYTVYEVEQYWPFPVSEEEKQRPENAEKLEFLESARSEGFEAYRVVQEKVRYCAKSQLRVGYIQKPDNGNRWQFVLSENGNERFIACVTDFSIAGTAVRAWLNGRLVSNILEDVNEYLTVPFGQKSSYTTYDSEDE